MGMCMPNYSKPTPEDFHKFGILAYVSKEERQRIMDLPAGHAKNQIRLMQREIDYLKKKKRI